MGALKNKKEKEKEMHVNPSTTCFNLGILWCNHIELSKWNSPTHQTTLKCDNHSHTHTHIRTNEVCHSFKYIPKSTKLHLACGNPIRSFILTHLEHYLIPNHSSTSKETTITT
jgi:hypothetical protein